MHCQLLIEMQNGAIGAWLNEVEILWTHGGSNMRLVPVF